jgi:hypothetical protein
MGVTIMKSLRVLSLSTVAICLVSTGAISQEKTLKQQIQGPWSLVSCNIILANGTKAPFCTNNPRGILILAGNGNYAATKVASGRKDFDAPGVEANFGTWSVDESFKTLTRHYVGALNPTIEGKDSKVSISLNGDELHLVGDNAVSVSGGHIDTTYRRFK